MSSRRRVEVMTRDQDLQMQPFVISIGSSGAPTLPTAPGDVIVGQTVGHPATGKYTFTIPNYLLGLSDMGGGLQVKTNTDATPFDGEWAVNMTTGLVTIRIYSGAGAAADPPSGSIITGQIYQKFSNRRAST